MIHDNEYESYLRERNHPDFAKANGQATYKGRYAGSVAMYHRVKSRAQSRGREFTLTKEWFAERLRAPRLCEVTGKTLVDPDCSGRGRSPWQASVDRIDSEEGYTPENCQMVCLIYNLAKNQFSEGELREMAEALL